jgi:hypothetical protein
MLSQNLFKNNTSKPEIGVFLTKLSVIFDSKKQIYSLIYTFFSFIPNNISGMRIDFICSDWIKQI